VIVADAGVVYAAIFDGGHSGDACRARLQVAGQASAPELIHVEVLNTARRLALAGRLDEAIVRPGIGKVDRLVECVPHAGLMPRAWQLRANVSPYDAVYVSLAELLGVPLVTGDRRLAGAPGPLCEREIVPVRP